jgi:tetratricopeptide (TPR) repeat protein
MTPRRFLLVAFLMAAAGCQAPAPVQSVDGSTWQAATSQPVQTPASFVTVTVLGETQPEPQALAALRKALRNAQSEPLENRALTFANLGIAAAHMGAVEEAAQALDGALHYMHALIYDPKKSREIASLSGKERTKIFKGEPYERALCNTYRGLLYLAQGEYESARACFRRGDMERSDAKLGEGKWLSLEYLSAVADDRCPSRLGVEWLREVPEELEVEPYSPGESTLVVAMTGLGPQKQHKRGGKEHGLTYGRYASAVAVLEIAASDPVVRLSRPTEDVFLQAVSNGRRQVDKLLEAKEQAAETGETVATVAETMSQVLVAVPYGGIAALPLLLLGTLSQGAAASTDATADLRMVVGPGAVYIATLPAANSSLTLRALDKSGTVIGESSAAASAAGTGQVRVVLARIYR